MRVEIGGNQIIKKQNLDLAEEIIGIYGYNNSGKTTVLREIDRAIDEKNEKSILSGERYTKSLFIPTNRIIVRQVLAGNMRIKDVEEFLFYKRDCYAEFDLHLRIIKELLLSNSHIRKYISEALKGMFGEYNFDFSKRQSDGVENIINIYCNIIWLLTWDQKIEAFQYETLKAFLRDTRAVIMIDEIEAFLHVYVQSCLLQMLKRDFSNCTIIFTTHSPLLLSRYEEIRKMHLKDGVLNEIDENLYFKSLDSIYEVYFDVDEFPKEAREIVNELGKYIMGYEHDKKEIKDALEILQNKYRNIRNKYIGLVTKAEHKLGE